MTRAARRALGALLTLAVLGAEAAPDFRPRNGHHAVELCVAVAPAPPSCGPAQAEVQSARALRVRVDDVSYRLQLHSRQADVVLMHNRVQIDAFTAPCEWIGATLRFDDLDRHSRYEVRFVETAAKR